MPDKKCTICEKEFPSTEEYFYKNGNGLSPYCKECSKEKAKKWKESHLEEYLSFHRKSRKKTRLTIREQRKYSDWRPSGKQLEWQRNNKDKISEYRLARNNKIHQISKNEWESCKKYFNYECAYCGIPIEENKKIYGQDFHKDHVVHDGDNDLSNCVPACKRCNCSKWEYDFENWYFENDFYDKEKHNKILKWLHEDYTKYSEQ
jgi:Holliday junction resolvase